MGSSSAVHTFRVNAENTGSGSVQLFSNANLYQLTVKAGGDELALTPVFAAETTIELKHQQMRYQ